MKKQRDNHTDEEKNLRIMQSQNNYNLWLYNQIKRGLHGDVLEIGCGTGTMTKLFLKNKNIKSITGTDINKKNLEAFKKNIKDKRVKSKILDITKTTKSLKKYDGVVCINVLEHIKDDQLAMVNIGKVLKKGGIALLIVPAVKKAYGTIDKADLHFRRYNKKETNKKLNKAGFEVKKIRYMNFPGLMGWIYHGRILKIRTHVQGDLSLFNKLVPLFEKIENLIHPPIGLSIVAVGVKR